MRHTADSQPLADSRADIIDFPALLKRCMGRVDLMARIIGTFRSAVVQDVEDLCAAIRNRDLTDVLVKTHRLKGTSLTASATSLARFADTLHTAVEAGESLEGEITCEKLATEIDALLTQISEWEAEVHREVN